MNHLLRVLGLTPMFAVPADQGGSAADTRDDDADSIDDSVDDDLDSRELDDGDDDLEDEPDPARDLDLESLGIDPPVRIGELQRRSVECEVRRSADGTRTIVVINTATLDSYRTEILPKGGDLKQYNKNPIVLINHDRYLVAGTSKVTRRDDRIVADMPDDKWDQDDPAILPWFNKVKRGIVRMASIGFIPVVVKRMLIDPEGEDRYDNWKWVIEKWILKEWSWVSIGSNPDALVESRAAQELHVTRLEDQITDLSRKLDELTALVRGEDAGTTAIDAPSDNAAADAASPESADNGTRDDAATQPASDVPDEPAAVAPTQAPGRRRSEQPRTAARAAIDPAAIASAVAAAIPGAVASAVREAAIEIGTQNLRARGKL